MFGGSAVDDALILQCKYWAVPMRFAVPKEKPDATAQRQALVRSELAAAEKAYNDQQKAAVDALRDWFYHTGEEGGAPDTL